MCLWTWPNLPTHIGLKSYLDNVPRYIIFFWFSLILSFVLIFTSVLYRRYVHQSIILVDVARFIDCHLLNGTEDVGAKLFPYQDPTSDRILAQLSYVPVNYESIRRSGRFKTIFINTNALEGLGPPVFQSCPVNTCEVVSNRTADLIIYGNCRTPTKPAYGHQLIMKYSMESPGYNNFDFSGANWTATYRSDSDIAVPYAKWVYTDPKVRQLEQTRNYAANKTKKVAMFVSNCQIRNIRLEYARDLQKYIQVDIYGDCGDLRCPRSESQRCFSMLERDYKFYLAFENSNCHYYITEKLFTNALKWNVLPIVMGARPEDYAMVAPHRSYIHVENFETPRHLAEYLHQLDTDDELYNSYFKWKGTGEFIDTKFWCRVCAALHDPSALNQPHCYPQDNIWWSSACTMEFWKYYEHNGAV